MRTAVLNIKERKMKKVFLMMAFAIVSLSAYVQPAYGQQSNKPLAAVYETYFKVKDALAKDNATLARAQAKTLGAAIAKTPMDKLGSAHKTWMDNYSKLKSAAVSISSTTDIAKQRSAFASLSAGMYRVMKQSAYGSPVYYQYCPMAKAGWLSREKKISNPYEGSKMPMCGEVKEELK